MFSNSSANISAKIGKLTTCRILSSHLNNSALLLNGYLNLTLES